MRRSKPDVEDPGACKRRALDLLARREHSRVELARKLRNRGFADSLVEPTLDELERSGVLANARFTESFVRSRVARGKGPIRIRAELAERGVAGGALGESDVDWVAAARAARVKRFGAAPPGDFTERMRQARFLQQRGFDRGQIEAALDGGTDTDGVADIDGDALADADDGL